MQLGDLAEKFRFGPGHVAQALMRFGLRPERNQVDGVPGAQCHADLAGFLGTADARAVPGARVEHHERSLERVGGGVGRRRDAQQQVVAGPVEAGPVEHGLVIEHQHRRLAGLVMVHRLVAAFSQRIEKQYRALGGIDEVLAGFDWVEEH